MGEYVLYDQDAATVEGRTDGGGTAPTGLTQISPVTLGAAIYRAFGGKGNYRTQLRRYRLAQNPCYFEASALAAAVFYDSFLLTSYLSGAGTVIRGAFVYRTGLRAVSAARTAVAAARGSGFPISAGDGLAVRRAMNEVILARQDMIVGYSSLAVGAGSGGLRGLSLSRLAGLFPVPGVETGRAIGALRECRQGEAP